MTTFDNILEVNNSDLSGVYTCSVGNLQNMAAINYTVTGIYMYVCVHNE